MNPHQAARDERAIDAAEDDIEHGHIDPIAEEHLQTQQDRYERAIGWTHE